jgi:hypothetical protein
MSRLKEVHIVGISHSKYVFFVFYIATSVVLISFSISYIETEKIWKIEKCAH